MSCSSLSLRRFWHPFFFLPIELYYVFITENTFWPFHFIKTGNPHVLLSATVNWYMYKCIHTHAHIHRHTHVPQHSPSSFLKVWWTPKDNWCLMDNRRLRVDGQAVRLSVPPEAVASEPQWGFHNHQPISHEVTGLRSQRQHHRSGTLASIRSHFPQQTQTAPGEDRQGRGWPWWEKKQHASEHPVLTL